MVSKPRTAGIQTLDNFYYFRNALDIIKNIDEIYLYRNFKTMEIHSTLVSNYVQHIIDSFLVSMAKHYDTKGNTHFKYSNKYYSTNIGLHKAKLIYRQYAPGHIMENNIANELLRRSYTVDIGVVTDRTDSANMQKEIDFVVNDANKKSTSSQLSRCILIKDSSEIASLTLTKDFFKKSLSVWIFP